MSVVLKTLTENTSAIFERIPSLEDGFDLTAYQ